MVGSRAAAPMNHEAHGRACTTPHLSLNERINWSLNGFIR